MHPLNEYREQIEKDLASCREGLEPLEKGELRQYTRKSDRDDWVETTQQTIDHYKRLIALFESILTKLKQS
jgi:hypothetical protein